LRSTPWIRIALTTIALVTSGCYEQNKGDAASGGGSSPTVHDAWWQQDGTASTPAQTAQTSVTPLPGWQKLPPLDPALAKKGAVLFTAKCASCHSIGRGQVVGPDLKGLSSRVEPDWAKAFMRDPGPLLASDAHAKQMLATYLVKMPNLQLSSDEIASLAEYLRQQDLTPAKP
jgi:protein SCO1/2